MADAEKTGPGRVGTCESRVPGRAPDRLIVFTRHPVPGRVKTRLIPALGPAGAAALQQAMTRHTLEVASVLEGDGVTVEVRFDGGGREAVRRWLGDRFPLAEQGDGDLGERMRRAFDDAFAAGTGRALLIGTDCPDLDAPLLRAARAALDRHDLVLGPARDGGYYLIGLRQPAPDLFRDVPWGTDTVLARTEGIARGLGLAVARLPVLDDVDRPEDLPVWTRAAAAAVRVSAIIPALNEAACLPALLDRLRAAASVETIVVDGGSRDGTPDIARARGAVVLSSAPGRGRQMNAGPAAATGSILLFLHADTVPPDGFDRIACRVLAVPGTACGVFRLRVGAPSAAFRLLEGLVQVRSRLLGLPYGDQALFVRADIFRRAGGFPEIPILEDVALVRRLRRLGRVAVVPQAVVTSPRRWEALGIARTTLVNQGILVAGALGISPTRLAGWYGRQAGINPG